MSNKLFNGSRDAIRIVPVYTPKLPVKIRELKNKKKDAGFFTAATRKVTRPKLVYNGGPILQNVEVFTIFWGANWASSYVYLKLAEDINDFFTVILKSALIDQLGEYNTQNPLYSIGYGTLQGTNTISETIPSGGTTISDETIQQTLNKWISSNVVPPVTPNRLYFIYLDNNVKVTLGGSASCTSFCGYHNNVGPAYYAVMPFPGCDGCLGGLSVLDALTATSSHELCEAITDAVPGSGWYDTNHGEIGDICAWKFKKIGIYNVQQEWSNAIGGCV